MTDGLQSSFPQPPRYYKKYTEENLSQNLQELLPPPPIHGFFEMYGEQCSIESIQPSLDTLDIQRIPGDPKQALSVLLKSLWTTYVDLLDTLATDTQNVV
jgi:hypothetical protein